MLGAGELLTKKTEEIYSLFEPVEGFNHVYFGKIRNGKTYAATADILELLKRGEIVYANWHIKFDGYDEREHFWLVLLKFLAGKKYFYNYKAENFHYIDTNSPTFIQEANKFVNVHLFIDEGQWIFNSHSKVDDVDKRRLILEGGHYCRSLNVITQRPSNIYKDVRSQVNVWYKCEKVFQWGSLIRFLRWEIEDMVDDMPIDPNDLIPEEKKKIPRKGYWGKKAIYEAYNTHGRRSEDAIEHFPEFDVYHFTPLSRFFLLWSLLFKRKTATPPLERGVAEFESTSKKDWEISSLKVAE